ncbi:MAG: glycoside hydrolase family 57 protein [Candidatus Gastranaerophilales bacterium]|nr:glycoside hydrolase family 57 protein [Candidatus Gastranaerophilales bacterium]
MVEKKFSIAFVWHLHQPSYKDPETNMYLMPWVRLHAIKDYLDMLLILDEFPKIKQTFNIVPLLMDQLEDYGHNGVHDVHSFLTTKPLEQLTEQDKNFILNSFFDANYNSMISIHPRYNQLYEKRYSTGANIEDFSDQEYSDIMMWFNLAWFDPHWVKNHPEVKALYKKERDYSLDDRIRVIDVQRAIIRQIIPTYRKRLEENKIEITTSPYYHCVLPLVANSDTAKTSMDASRLPRNTYKHPEDAVYQIEKSIKKFEDVFGQKPKGLWPSEQCISNESLKLIKKAGFKWTISDEGVLARTLGTGFERDLHGLLQNPYPLCNAYNFGKEEDALRLVFRSSFLANLINFQYGSYDPKVAAEDLYGKLKAAQKNLEMSPDNNHIAVIALDGENCWESYQKDGIPFLKHLYEIISEDSSMEAITVSEYMDKIEKEHVITDIYPGSWINRDFQMWIGDPVKNLAWDYLVRIRKDLEKFSKEKHDKETISKAWEEFYVAQGSDWFWWFGEPNDSGQDELFDFLFRNHLKQIYKILGKEIPSYLERPLETLVTKQSYIPKDLITPQINGLVTLGDWENAGYIQNVQGPVYNVEKLFSKIYFGNDKKNIYLRFDINKYNIENMKDKNIWAQIMLYFQGFNNNPTVSYMRMRQTKDYLTNVMRYAYSHEVEIPIMRGDVMPVVFSKLMENMLWELVINHDINLVHNQVFEMSIPFDDLNIRPGEKVNMTIVTGKSGVVDEIITKDRPISFIRP